MHAPRNARYTRNGGGGQGIAGRGPLHALLPRPRAVHHHARGRATRAHALHPCGCRHHLRARPGLLGVGGAGGFTGRACLLGDVQRDHSRSDEAVRHEPPLPLRHHAADGRGLHRRLPHTHRLQVHGHARGRHRGEAHGEDNRERGLGRAGQHGDHTPCRAALPVGALGCHAHAHDPHVCHRGGGRRLLPWRAAHRHRLHPALRPGARARPLAPRGVARRSGTAPRRTGCTRHPAHRAGRRRVGSRVRAVRVRRDAHLEPVEGLLVPQAVGHHAALQRALPGAVETQLGDPCATPPGAPDYAHAVLLPLAAKRVCGLCGHSRVSHRPRLRLGGVDAAGGRPGRRVVHHLRRGEHVPPGILLRLHPHHGGSARAPQHCAQRSRACPPEPPRAGCSPQAQVAPGERG
mmetsp:Transcript_18730/g.59352  ORF Transcript_18730/g.59352 Transcript_18730/m.59352 type:complete len:405 (+) Transcript_18730:2652-3866(+)